MKNEERLVPEEIPSPPAFPRRDRLIEFSDAHAGGFRLFVDPDSISVGKDRIVRYVLVARSDSGVENVTFEGLRCTGEYRIYATGRPDGTWAIQSGTWREALRDGTRGTRATLGRQFFCVARVPVMSAEEAVAALKAGGRNPHR